MFSFDVEILIMNKYFFISADGPPDKNSQVSTILLGGTSTAEGDVMTMNSHLEFGPICNATFGYNEVLHIEYRLDSR